MRISISIIAVDLIAYPRCIMEEIEKVDDFERVTSPVLLMRGPA